MIARMMEAEWGKIVIPVGLTLAVVAGGLAFAFAG
jgi:hypothetical protein